MATCDEALREQLEAQYTTQLEDLRQEILATDGLVNDQDGDLKVNFFLASRADYLDDRLATFVVLKEATPKALAEFAATTSDNNNNNKTSKSNQELIQQLLGDPQLMKQMVLADGAKEGKYGRAMQIYVQIQEEREQKKKNDDDDQCLEGQDDFPVDPAKQKAPVLDRLALALSLEHAVPLPQHNPDAVEVTPENATVNPIKRFFHYQRAFVRGELDPNFWGLSTWLLRMVIDGDEPDETLVWGRHMLRNFTPGNVITPNQEWRYVALAKNQVKYGSENVKFDRPELQQYQNILMNGGICGRIAWIGRFILRAFGIPTTARPSRGHGALCHWTADKGWCVNLGPGWGRGWTKGLYHNDVDFLATTKARDKLEGYWNVKRAQWMGDVYGEKRVYGAHDKENHPSLIVGFWYGTSLRIQQAILDDEAQAATPLLEDPARSTYKPTVAETLIATPVPADAKTISYHNDNNEIRIPCCAHEKGAQEVYNAQCFKGGWQTSLKAFFPKGLTIMRGGTWKSSADDCASGCRLLSGGYGKYNNWGFRVAISQEHSLAKVDSNGNYPEELSIAYRDDSGVTIEFVYIKPGSFLMGGESTEDGRFQCVEVPKHQVEITTGFYMGKYPVTQAQYEAMMGSNPSGSTKEPDCPVDTIGESDASAFCQEFTVSTGRSARLPTEAEWEYASRAGRDDTKWFFGDDASQMGEYAWFKDNADMKSHPVGQKKPNPWGLYDIYGNVCERISDKYEKDYYEKQLAISPSQDPEGPSVGTSSNMEFKINVARSGEYKLFVEVVTVNYNQRITVAVNGVEVVMQLPFTNGSWQQTEPIAILLQEGEATLRVWRDKPPQKEISIRDFCLTTADSPSAAS